MRITLNEINKALAANPELYGVQLVRGASYFYFAGGCAHRWQESGVPTNHLSSMTVDSWVDEALTRQRKFAHDDLFNDEYHEGYAAAETQDAYANTCPYEPLSYEWHSWRRGFESFSADVADRRFCQ